MKLRVIAGAVVLGTAVLLTGCSSMNQETHTNCEVLHKERLLQGGNSGEKRVTTSCGVFTVEDSWSGGFESYDVFNRLEVGKRYYIQAGN